MPKLIIILFVIVSYQIGAQGGSMKHNDTKLGHVVTVAAGNSVSLKALTVKLVSLTPYSNDETVGKLKTKAVLKISKGALSEEITIGEFAETMRYSLGHVFMLVSVHNQEAKIRICDFSLSLDAGDIEPSMKQIPIDSKNGIKIGEYVVMVKDLSHVDEYGSYFSLNFTVGKAGNTQEFHTGDPVSFDNLIISLHVTDFSKGVVQIRKLGLADIFKLAKGQTVELKGPGISVELVDQVDNHKDKVEYTLKISKGSLVFVGKIVQGYTVPMLNHIPPGKTPLLEHKLDRNRSHLVYTFDMYSIENVILYDILNSDNRNSFVIKRTN